MGQENVLNLAASAAATPQKYIRGWDWDLRLTELDAVAQTFPPALSYESPIFASIFDGSRL